MPSTERAMIEDNRERYINPYTDFGFKKLFEQAEIARFTPEERRAYEESVKIFRDNTNTADFAVSEAEKKGKTKGKLEIAQRMKAKGYPIEDIAEMTELSPEQIEKL